MADVTIVGSIHSHHPRIPLGPLYLSSSLEAHGFQVEFRDYQTCRGPGIGTPEHFVSWLSDPSPILALSTLSSSLPLVLSSLSRSELRNRVETVILGGPGVGTVGPRILEHFPQVDFVISGEGEESLPNLVEGLRTGASLTRVGGLSYRAKGGISSNPPGNRIEPLDRIPFPAYAKVHLPDYDRRSGPGRKTPLGILSARGCPYNCTFCDIPGLWPGGVRYRSVPQVVEELEGAIETFGVREFTVLDDTFLLDKERVLHFCALLKERGLTLPWSCLGRVDRMDEEILVRLADAGCETVFLGIESGSNRVLRKIRKRFKIAEAMEVVRMSLDHVRVQASFVWGFPFETMEDFQDTLVALLAMRGLGAEPRLSFLAPLPTAEMTRSFGTSMTRRTVWEIGWTRALLDDYEYNEELREIVHRHPDIFTPFYCMDSPDFQRKVKLLEGWGLGLGTLSQPLGSLETRRQPLPDLSPPDLLPTPSPEVHLRTLAGKDYLLDAAGGLLYEPTPPYARVFRACQRKETVGQVTKTLADTSGVPVTEAHAFVRRVLRKFSERGFLG